MSDAVRFDDETLPTYTRGLSRDPVADPSPAPRPARAPLRGATVELHPVDRASQLDSLYALSHADDRALALWEYLPYGPFPDPGALGDRLDECERSEDPLYFSVYDIASEHHAGMTSYLRINEAMRSIEIGHIWFAPVIQNNRQSTEALYLMMRHAFDDLGYRRLEWKCNALNAGSRSAARRLGFTYEGIFYRSMIVKGLNRDTAWYAIIEEEWPGIRANFESWLGDGNFDAGGRQRQSLGELNRREPAK